MLKFSKLVSYTVIRTTKSSSQICDSNPSQILQPSQKPGDGKDTKSLILLIFIITGPKFFNLRNTW